MEKSVICPNCGGEYAEWALKCPYCGSVNDKGAEKVYLEHLEAIKDRLDRVDEESEADYKQTVSRSVRKIIIAAAAAVLAAALIMAGYLLVSELSERKYEKEYLAQAAFEKEEYPRLNALYEKGDYDAIIEEYYSVLMDNSDYSIYSWAHYYYIFDYYEAYRSILEAETEIADGRTDSYTLGNAIEAALRFRYEETGKHLKDMQAAYKANNGCYGLTAEEAEKVAADFLPEGEKFLTETLGWTDQECRDFYEECTESGYLSLRPCLDKADELISTNGWED